MNYVYRVVEVLKVVDGDTVDLKIDLGFHLYHHIRVRLKEYNAPEIRGPERPQGLIVTALAKQWLEENADKLLVKTKKTGKYGRWLGVIFNEETGISLSVFLRANELTWQDQDDSRTEN